jgi:hypothetical protein
MAMPDYFLVAASLLIVLVVELSIRRRHQSTIPTPERALAPPFPEIAVNCSPVVSADPHAEIAKRSIARLVAFTESFAPYRSMSPAKKGDTWIWLHTTGELNVALTVIAQDGVHTWSCLYSGKNAGAAFVDWVAWEGSTCPDGKSGMWRVYDEASPHKQSPAVAFEWSTDSRGSVTATILDFVAGVVTVSLTVAGNPDGSGEVAQYTGVCMTFKSTWSSGGAGSWWTYDPETGSETESGTWT